MSDTQTLVAGGVGTGFTIALFILYRVIVPAYTAVNHKRIRSVCCGRNCTTSLDVEDTTPVPHPDAVAGGTGTVPSTVNPIHV